MELPMNLTTELKFIQNQMKLAIQTHQNMRTSHTNDPNLHEDLREIEKRISSLGEKQNQLMRLLRKIITSNNALMAKTIITSLGFAINGSNEYAATSQFKALNNHVLSPKTCNAAGLTSTKEQTQNKSSKLTVQKKAMKGNPEMKESRMEGVKKIGRERNETGHIRMRVGRPSKKSLVVSSVDVKQQQLPDSSERLSEPLTAEKERFLSAVGLVTREILKELQNKRVERKRRSTANHTQFVYGSSWDISSKKRKKNNYLTSSSLKQPVTRQANKTQNPKMDIPKSTQTVPKVDAPVVIFKSPLPVTLQNQPLIVEPSNSCNALHQTVMKNQLVLKSQSVLKSPCVTKSQSVLKTQTITKSQSLLKSQPIMKSLPSIKSAPIEKISVGKSQSISKIHTIMRSPTFPKSQTIIKSHTVVKNPTIVTNKDGYVERLSPSIPSQKKGNECRIVETCIVCHKLAAGAIACSCNMRYHPSCAERIENCLGCGYKIKSNFRDRRAEKHRLQELNNKLNLEKQLLETRAAELNVSLGTQAEQKKNLLSTEDMLRKKIQSIHDFVLQLQSSHSIPT